MHDALDAFRDILRYPTTAGAHHDPAACAGLHAALPRWFPRLFTACESVDLGSEALLLRWPGSEGMASPLVLMAHQDVVPIEPDDVWTHPPFDAALVGEGAGSGVLWGRGTLSRPSAKPRGPP